MTGCVSTRLEHRTRWHRWMAMTATVLACMFVGNSAQAQPCPAPTPPGNGPTPGGGPPAAGGAGAAPQRSGSGQGAFQLVNLAQQAMQIQQLINYRRSDQAGRQQPRQITRPQTQTAKKGKVRLAKLPDKSRPMTRREKLIARLKQRALERKQKADDLRARRGRSK